MLGVIGLIEATSCDSEYDSEYDGTGGTDSDDTADNIYDDPESSNPEPDCE